MKDSNEKKITCGSVLRKITTNEVGIVERISEGNEGGTLGGMFLAVNGDIIVRMMSGVRMVSSQYHNWIHVPHDDQTLEQRYWSWRLSDKQELECIDDETIAINCLIDESTLEDADYPVNFSDSLLLLVKQINKARG